MLDYDTLVGIVKELTEKRGMRVSRAVSKVLYENGMLTETGTYYNADLIKHVSTAIEQDFQLVISRNPEMFVRAYREVSSCMQYGGQRVADFYLFGNSGYAIAVLINKAGHIVARCIVNTQDMTRCDEVYGGEHYLLRSILNISWYGATTTLHKMQSAILRAHYSGIKLPGKIRSEESVHVNMHWTYETFYVRDQKTICELRLEIERWIQNQAFCRKYSARTPVDFVFPQKWEDHDRVYSGGTITIRVLWIQTARHDNRKYAVFNADFPLAKPYVDFNCQDLDNDTCLGLLKPYIVNFPEQEDDAKWWEDQDDTHFFQRARKGKAKHKLK